MTDSIELARGGDAAVISIIGAGLHSYTVAGRPVVVPLNVSDGAVLAPWPNRIADVRWSLTERTDASARLETLIAPSAGHPFSLALSLDYELGEQGLSVRAGARNTGSTAAPFGLGFHPWFDPGAGAVDEAQLVVPARTWIETGDRLIPTEARPFDDGSVVPVDHAADESACIVCKDFRALRAIGRTVLDDAFGDPRRGEDGWSWARLRGADDREIRIGMGRGFRAWQVCTGDGLESHSARRAIAIGPMSCPPHAFADGADFDAIGPDDELSLEWCISLAPTSPTSLAQASPAPDAEGPPKTAGDPPA